MSTLVELRGVTKNYQLGATLVPALRGVDLDVARGEFTVVMGPSGSGKSTLLNIIGCLDQPTAGTYRLDGQPVEGHDFDDLADVRNRKIGFIFQSFNLIPVLNVVENVEFPCLLSKNREPAAALRKRVMALADEVGLGPFVSHKPDELSGGQRQRVAIARATIMQPALILADEPTGNLDRHTGEEVVNLLEALNASGVTLVVVTHDQAMGARARRQLVMEDGRLKYDSGQLAHAPA